MVIFIRVYDLLDWLLPKSERFPKVYRHTITQRLMNSVLDLHDALGDAQASRARERLRALQAADAALVKLRNYLKLVHRWQWLSHGQYQHVSEMVAEIGRLLGGWLRQAGQFK